MIKQSQRRHIASCVQIFFITVLVLSSLPCFANEDPLTQVKESIDRIIDILQSEDTGERWIWKKEEIVRIVKERFDSEELAQRVAELEKEASYFSKNQCRMNYQEMREDGWAIGSGMVESAAKQFKARFAGPGMRWSRSGAERLIPIRAAVMSKRFDILWDTAYNLPLN